MKGMKHKGMSKSEPGRGNKSEAGTYPMGKKRPGSKMGAVKKKSFE